MHCPFPTHSNKFLISKEEEKECYRNKKDALAQFHRALPEISKIYSIHANQSVSNMQVVHQNRILMYIPAMHRKWIFDFGNQNFGASLIHTL